MPYKQIICSTLLILILVTFYNVNSYAEDNIISKCWGDNTTHVEANTCLQQLLTKSQNTLESLIQKAKQNTLNLQKQNLIAKKTNQLLQNAKTNFENYKNNVCKWIQNSYGSGSGAGTGYLNCLINANNDFSNLIKSMIQ